MAVHKNSWIGIKAASIVLGVSVQRVHQMIAEGKLTPIHKHDGKTGPYILDKSEVRKLRESSTK